MFSRWKPTGADVIACLLTGAFSAWLWSRGMERIGIAAPFIGAAIGVCVGYACRCVC